MLRGLSVAAVAAAAGCGGSGSTGPDAGPDGAATMCGANLCVDLGDPANAALSSVDGSLVVTAPRDRILIIRVSPTAFEAVSDICTHASCAVGYAPGRKRIRCPCHGSEYEVTGQVIAGPAPRSLTRYETAHDTSTNVLTIML